jgi:alkylation response protein AidB-like acyl-CoA dehydrogenase
VVSIPQDPLHPELDEAAAFLAEHIAPAANRIDNSVDELIAAVRLLARHGWLGLRVPKEFGGAGFSDVSFRRFQESCARSSGALAFLQTQHQSASSLIARGSNERLKREMLPSMASGETLCGIAFSQLRKRASAPLLEATPSSGGGVVLNGMAPWVTGAGIFQNCVTAATTPEGNTLFVAHSLSHPGIELSSPFALAALEVVQTVSARYVNCEIDAERIVMVESGNWIENNDTINISLQSPFALGCAGAGLDCLLQNSEKKTAEGLAETHRQLSGELDRCRVEAYAAMDARSDTSRGLAARAWAIDMAFRCSAAAVVSSSGAGNSMTHSAQRIYREALVFAVSAQTTDIMVATLGKLASRA